MKEMQKLKEELKSKLSLDEMDNVAGGSWIESYAIDLNNAYERKLPGFEKMNPYDSETAVYCLKNWDSVVSKLKTMFAGYGIEMTYNGKPTEENVYTYNGNKVTIDEAWKIIDSKIG